MPTFVYKAKKRTAETVSGQISARSQDEAIDLIHQLGLLPVSVEPESLERSLDQGISKIIHRRVRGRELYQFSRQLANLLKSGVTILRALAIIEEQTANPYFKNILARLVLEIKNGRSLSESLANYPQIFSPLFVLLVHAGEESGNLQEMLVNVSVYQRTQAETASKVRNALVYPSFMAFVGIVTVYFILTFVLPKMSGLFENIGDLPWPTQLMLGMSRVLKTGGVWILLGAAVAAAGVYQWGRSSVGQMMMGRLALRLPLFGPIILKAQLARFCRTLALLLRSGVAILRALQIAIPALNNEVLKGHLTVCRERLSAGGSLGAGLKQIKVIPPMMGHLIAIGEESGNLDDVLGEVSEIYEQEINDSIKMLAALLEPVMILAVGSIVGFIVFAMLLPIFQMDVMMR